MTEPHEPPHGGHTPDDAPDHPEPDPQLRGFPPPAPPGFGGYPPPAYAPAPPGPGRPYWPSQGQSTGQSKPSAPLPVGLQPYPPALYPPALYPPAPYPPAFYGPPPRLPALPTQPSRYSQLLRGPRYRWWKPLLTAALTLGLYLGFVMVTLVPPLVAGLVTGTPDLANYVFTTLTDLGNLGPVGFIAINLSLVVLIPATMLSVWIVHGVRPKFLSSVAGGIRWRWMLRCLLVVVPVWLLYVGVTLLFGVPTGGPPPQWLALLLIVLVLTPFQAAGEEYLFRGWIMQNVGAWFARPVVGLVVVTVISTATFSAAHLSPDPWVLGSLGCLAVAGCLATWRTGGLEAAIAMHTVNNLLVFFVTLGFGGWQDAFVDTETTGTAIQFLLSVAVHGVALALIWWQAGRTGLPYLSPPSTLPALPQQPQAWHLVAPANRVG